LYSIANAGSFLIATQALSISVVLIILLPRFIISPFLSSSPLESSDGVLVQGKSDKPMKKTREFLFKKIVS
jgi:hypothetical protein